LWSLARAVDTKGQGLGHSESSTQRDETNKVAEEEEWTREREPTQRQIPTTKATESPKPARTSVKEEIQRQPAGDWYYMHQPFHPTEGDSAIDIMDRPPLIVSQEEAKAWRSSIKQRQEDEDGENSQEKARMRHQRHKKGYSLFVSKYCPQFQYPIWIS